MEKKLMQMNEAFEHLRFTDCLSIIDQLVKKFTKPDKKNKALGSTQLKVVKCFKVGSLVSLGRHHEAHHIYKQLCEGESLSLIGADYTYLLVSISELFMDRDERTMLQLLEKHSPNHKKQALYRFYLSCRMFSNLSKLFLKDFVTSKNIMTQFGQVYLQYLTCLDKNGLIQYKRDGWYKCQNSLKGSLKMVNMFLDKCIKGAQDALVKSEKEIKEGQLQIKEAAEKNFKLSQKVISRSNELKLKIAINEGRALDAMKLFDQIRGTLKFPFTFLRSILQLRQSCEERESIQTFYVDKMSAVFRTNLDFEKYTPWYDYYNQFLWETINRAEKVNPDIKKKVELKEINLPLQELYKFSNEPIEIIQQYYSSLYSEFTYLTNTQNPKFAENKKSDYYKICLKGLLLQLIQISNYLSKKESLVKYLKQFKAYFVNTLTYASEMKKFWRLLMDEKILVKLNKVENDNQLIEEINFQKIRISVETKTPTHEGFNSVYKQLKELYHLRVKEIEKNRKLEKGQRYISDEFYTLISDYARAYIQTQTSFKAISNVLETMIVDLEDIIEVSPYNADTKLRLMYFCGLLNHSDRVLEIYFSSDIKSVQCETLGYWFLRVGVEFGLGESHDQFIDKFVKSYQQNQRETSEYGLKALKVGELDRVDEYLCYRTCLQNSYNIVLILYFLYQRYRFEPHSEYYLLKINQKLNKFKKGETQLTFNSDFRVMKNQLFEDLCFGQFYGVYTNWQILQHEVNIYLHEHAVIGKLMDSNCDELTNELTELDKLDEIISSLEVANAFNFEKYTFQEERPNFKCQNSKFTTAKNGEYLKHLALVCQVRITVIMLASQLHNFIKQIQLNKQGIEDLRQKISKRIKALGVAFAESQHQNQLHSITMIRRGLFESYNLLHIIKELVQKNKKMKAAKEVVVSVTESIMELLFETILNLKWTHHSKLESKLIENRSQILERQLAIDTTQIKRTLTRYQSVYKW